MASIGDGIQAPAVRRKRDRLFHPFRPATRTSSTSSPSATSPPVSTASTTLQPADFSTAAINEELWLKAQNSDEIQEDKNWPKFAEHFSATSTVPPTVDGIIRAFAQVSDQAPSRSRDIFGRLIDFANGFKDVGAAAAAADKHAAGVWALLSFLIATAVKAKDTYSIARRSETIASIKERNDALAKLYLNSRAIESIIQARISNLLENLYIKVLKYVITGWAYIQSGKLNHAIKSLTPHDPVRNAFDAVIEAEQAVRVILEPANAELSFQTNEMGQRISTGLEKLQQPLQRSFEEVSALYRDLLEQQRDRVLSWLSDIKEAQRLDELMASHMPGTGNWFLSHTEFVSWKHSTESSWLFLNGKMGTGKSTLVALALTEIFKEYSDPKMGLCAYYFCDKTSIESQKQMRNPSNIFRCLLRQLLDNSDISDLSEILDLYSQRQRSGRALTQEEITDLIILSVDRLKNVTFVIDAVDECEPEPRVILIETLKDLQRLVSGVFKVLLSSRPCQEMVHDLSHMPLWHSIETDNVSDIEVYINERVHKHIQKSSFQTSLMGRQNEISRILASKASGQFRHAVYALDYLSRRDFMDMHAEAIALPPELADLYERSYVEAQGHYFGSYKCLESTISILLCQRVELTASELLQAVFDPYILSHIDEPHSLLLKACAGFVELDEQPPRFRLAHSSVKDYFDQNPHFTPERANARIAKLCLEHVSLHFRTRIYGSAITCNSSAKWNQGDFICYALCQWVSHLAEGQFESEAEKAFLLELDLLEGMLHAEESSLSYWFKTGRELICELQQAGMYADSGIGRDSLVVEFGTPERTSSSTKSLLVLPSIRQMLQLEESAVRNGDERDPSTHVVEDRGGRFFCIGFPPCNEAFELPEQLSRHRKVHSAAKTFVCRCGCRFSGRYSLWRHQRACNPSNKPPNRRIPETSPGTREPFSGALKRRRSSSTSARSENRPSLRRQLSRSSSITSMVGVATYGSRISISNGSSGRLSRSSSRISLSGKNQDTNLTSNELNSIDSALKETENAASRATFNWSKNFGLFKSYGDETHQQKAEPILPESLQPETLQARSHTSKMPVQSGGNISPAFFDVSTGRTIPSSLNSPNLFHYSSRSRQNEDSDEDVNMFLNVDLPGESPTEPEALSRQGPAPRSSVRRRRSRTPEEQNFCTLNSDQLVDGIAMATSMPSNPLFAASAWGITYLLPNMETGQINAWTQHNLLKLTPLVAAIQRFPRTRDLCFLMIDSCPKEAIHAASESGVTPLHAVCALRTSARYIHDINHMALELVQKSANVNSENESGETPLHFAVRVCNTALVAFLLNEGADINASNTKSYNSFWSSIASSFIRGGSKQAVEMLQVVNLVAHERPTLLHGNVEGCNLLHVAAAYDSYDLALQLLDAGVDINLKATIAHNSTALHIAANGPASPLVPLLLLRGADVDARDDYGRTPLHCAASMYAVVKLTDNRARTDILDELGRTPLDAAIARGASSAVECFLLYSLRPVQGYEKGLLTIYSNISVRCVMLLLRRSIYTCISILASTRKNQEERRSTIRQPKLETLDYDMKDFWDEDLTPNELSNDEDFNLDEDNEEDLCNDRVEDDDNDFFQMMGAEQRSRFFDECVEATKEP